MRRVPFSKLRSRTCGWVFVLLGAGLAACAAGSAPGDAGLDADAGDDCPGCWRSALYPKDWTPAFTDSQGRFLHDFSFAGYHRGEASLPETPPGPRVSVQDHGADPTGEADSTASIQAAIDGLGAGGGTIEFPEGIYRCDGLLRVTHSGVVLRGAGADVSRLFFTLEGGMDSQASLSFRGTVSSDLELPLVEDAVPRSGDVRVADAADLAPGDDVELGIVVSDEFIAEHGMTGTWEVSRGLWRAFFRRTVVGVDRQAGGAVVRLDVPLRYPLKTRDLASVRRVRGLLSEVGIEDLGLSNAVGLAAALGCNRAHVLQFVSVKDAWARRLRSFPSPASEDGDHLQSGGILVQGSMRVTVEATTLERAQNRGSGGNGYLFEIFQSGEVLVRDCTGRAGRHNFIQNWDFGTSGCVFLRPVSEDGVAEAELADSTGLSEFHHSLAMANLIDGAVSNDGWGAVNRLKQSSGAGHTATENVFWNARGGVIRSMQFGWGYVIGTREVEVYTGLDDLFGQATGTAPEDFVEGQDLGEPLEPESLYEDQLLRRLETLGD